MEKIKLHLYKPVLCCVRIGTQEGFLKIVLKLDFFSALLKEAANKSGYISEHFLCSVDFKEIYFCKDLKYQSARV